MVPEEMVIAAAVVVSVVVAVVVSVAVAVVVSEVVVEAAAVVTGAGAGDAVAVAVAVAVAGVAGAAVVAVVAAGEFLEVSCACLGWLCFHRYPNHQFWYELLRLLDSRRRDRPSNEAAIFVFLQEFLSIFRDVAHG